MPDKCATIEKSRRSSFDSGIQEEDPTECSQLKEDLRNLNKKPKEKVKHYQKLLDEKDREIRDLIAGQAAINNEVHNLTEDLFKQAYLQVNQEKELSSNMIFRIKALEKKLIELKYNSNNPPPPPSFVNRLFGRRKAAIFPEQPIVPPNIAPEKHSMMIRAPPLPEQSPAVKALLDEARGCNKQDTEQLGILQNKLTDKLCEVGLRNQELCGYINKLVSRVMEMCPEVLEVNDRLGYL